MTPLTRGIETVGRCPTTLIGCNTAIPASNLNRISKVADRPTPVMIRVLQGGCHLLPATPFEASTAKCSARQPLCADCVEG